MSNIKEILTELKKPFAPQDHIERELPGSGRWFFIPWQRIRERLDEACPDWQVEYSTPVYLGDHCVINCTLTIAGVSRMAPGNAPIELLSKSGKDMSRGTPIERAIADAFKNAAEAFGVGAYLDVQAQDKREFMLRYMQAKGDGRAVQFARENNWVPGSLPTAEQKKAAQREQPKPFGQPSGQSKASGLNRPITEGQVKRLWTIARQSGYSDVGVKALIGRYGYQSTRDILGEAYDEIVRHAEDAELAKAFNEEGAQFAIAV